MKPALITAAAVAGAFTLGRRLGDTAGYHRGQLDSASEALSAWEQGAAAVEERFRAIGAVSHAALARRQAVSQRAAGRRGLQ